MLRFAQRFEHDGDNEEHGQDINLVASLVLLMGQAYEATGNRDNAALYFRIALQCDVYCSEVSMSSDVFHRPSAICLSHVCTQAFFHLFDKQMLSAGEEKQLLESMNFTSDKMDLLQLLYRTHVGKVRRNCSNAVILGFGLTVCMRPMGIQYDATPSIDVKFAEVEETIGLKENLDLV